MTRPYTLVVPDMHQRLDSFVKLTKFNDAHAVVFLGDYFDSHSPDAYTASSTADFLRKRLESLPDATWLLGNHDCHYLFNHPGFRCSGFQGEAVKAEIQAKLLPYLDKFKLHTWVGPYLLSHAGFHPFALCQMEDEPLTLEHVPPYLESVTSEALRNARAGGFHWLFYPGADVGGTGYGGPTWMRWKRYVSIPGLPQIMGHTWQKDGKVRKSYAYNPSGDPGTSYMLDTGLHCVAKIYHDDWSVEVVKL